MSGSKKSSIPVHRLAHVRLRILRNLGESILAPFYGLGPIKEPEMCSTDVRNVLGADLNRRRVSHLQCAALPYRRRADSTIEVMLITSRDTGRWLIPKGWRKPRLGAAASAAREAHEEGGLIGRIGEHSIGLFHYDKRLPDGSTAHCMVEVFAFEVEKQLSRGRSAMNVARAGSSWRRPRTQCWSRNYARSFAT